MTVQNRFDFTELDPETPHFHLMIQPAQEIEVAIRSTAHLVTGPVEPPSRLSAEGVRHESLRCEIRTPQVAPGHAGTSEGDRPPGVSFLRAADPFGYVDRDLRRAVLVPQHRAHASVEQIPELR